MQVARAFLAAQRRSQIALGAWPSFREAGPDQNDRIHRDRSVLLLEALDVVGGHLVVGVTLALLRDVDDDRRTHQLLNGNLVDGQMSFREMNRRIDVRATVLGGEEAVGGVVIACRGDAVSVAAELEPLGRGPVDRLGVVGVREVDDFACRKGDSSRRARACRHQNRHKRHEPHRVFHVATLAAPLHRGL